LGVVYETGAWFSRA